MIEIKDLTIKDRGRYVLYNNGFIQQKGRIKDWNQTYIFVVYNCANQWHDYQNYTAAATKPEELIFDE